MVLPEHQRVAIAEGTSMYVVVVVPSNTGRHAGSRRRVRGDPRPVGGYYYYYYDHHHHHLLQLGFLPGGSSPTLVQTKIKITQNKKISTQTEHGKRKYNTHYKKNTHVTTHRVKTTIVQDAHKLKFVLGKVALGHLFLEIIRWYHSTSASYLGHLSIAEAV